MNTAAKSLPESRKGLFAKIGDFFFFHRNWMSGLLMIALVALCKPIFPGGNRHADLWLDVVAFAVIFFGQGLRAMVIGLTHIDRGGKAGKVWANKLLTEGLFSHCRNPLYVGNVMVYFGLFLLLNNPWAYLIGMSYVLLMYKSIIAAEETFLRGKFGADYDEYCSRTPRWAIRPGGLCDTVKGMTFQWIRVINKEYCPILTWILMSMAILAREASAVGELGMQYWQTQAIVVVLVVAILSYATVRHLKVNGRLATDN